MFDFLTGLENRRGAMSLGLEIIILIVIALALLIIILFLVDKGILDAILGIKLPNTNVTYPS